MDQELRTQHNTLSQAWQAFGGYRRWVQGHFGAKPPTSWWNLKLSLKAGLKFLICRLRVLVAGASKWLSGLSLQRAVRHPDFGRSWAWTWQLLLPPGYILEYFSTFILNKKKKKKKGLKVDCRGFTNKIAKDKMLLGRQRSWLLLPAVGSPSNYIAGAIMFDLFTSQSGLE